MTSRRNFLIGTLGVVAGLNRIKSHVLELGNTVDWRYGTKTKTGDTYTMSFEDFPVPKIVNGSVEVNYAQADVEVPVERYNSKDDGMFRRSGPGFHNVITNVRNSKFGEKILNDLVPDSTDNEFLSVMYFSQLVSYARDYNSTERLDYTRYPSETLVEGVGDCKDRTVLFNALLSSAGYDVGYAWFPAHVTPIIKADSIPASVYPSEVTIDVDGETYIIIETVGDANGFGELVENPEQLILTYTDEFTVFDPEAVSTHIDRSVNDLSEAIDA